MLTAISKSTRLARPSRSRVFQAAAVACVLLLALLAFAQVAHTHPAGTDTDHCALCVVLHSTVPVAAAAAIVLFARVAFTVPLQTWRPVTRYWHAQLLNRPPPIACLAFFGIA